LDFLCAEKIYHVSLKLFFLRKSTHLIREMR